MKKVRHRYGVRVWTPGVVCWLFGYSQPTVALIPIIRISIYDYWNIIRFERIHITEYAAADGVIAAGSSVRAGRIENESRGCRTRAVLGCRSRRLSTGAGNRNWLRGIVVRWRGFPHAPLGKCLGELG
jgi:hypothetical protein